MLPSTYNFPCTRQGSWSYLSVTFSRHFHFSGRVASPAQPAAWTGPKPREGFGLNGTAWKTVDRPRPGVKTDAVSSGDTPTAARSHAAHETGHPRLSIFSQTLKRLHGQPPSHSQQVSGESLDTTEPKLRPTNTKGSIMPSGNKNERPSKLRKAAPVFPEDDATRQLGRSTDASNLPRMPTLDVGHKRVVRFEALDLSTALGRNNRNQLEAANPLFRLRALPMSNIPPRPPPPFPPHLLRRQEKPKALKTMRLGFIITKAHVSKMAHERVRARRRLKEALNLVVNRGMSCPPGMSGWDLIDQDLAYFFHVNPTVVTIPFDELSETVYKTLAKLRENAQRRQGVRPQRTSSPKRFVR